MFSSVLSFILPIMSSLFGCTYLSSLDIFLTILPLLKHGFPLEPQDELTLLKERITQMLHAIKHNKTTIRIRNFIRMVPHGPREQITTIYCNIFLYWAFHSYILQYCHIYLFVCDLVTKLFQNILCKYKIIVKKHDFSLMVDAPFAFFLEVIFGCYSDTNGMLS